MASEVKLCEYRSCITLDQLKHPTVAELRHLAEPSSGEDPATSLRYGRPSQSDSIWNLGRQSRITNSSASCPLCFAVCELLQQQPRIKQSWSTRSWKDPTCFAFLFNSGHLRPPDPMKWKGGSEESIIVHRLSLTWQQTDGDKLLPGSRKSRMSGPSISLYDCFQLSPQGVPSLEETLLMEPSCLGADYVTFGGRRRPEMLDTRLPTKWIRDCVESHGQTCCFGAGVGFDDKDKDIELIRLVDVQTCNIVEFKDRTLFYFRGENKYVALSYVWGGPQPLMLTTSNLTMLQQPGSLGSIAVPKTIQDAMIFVSSQGIRYLWVDCLCIVQDDNEDKAVQIEAMDSIYLQAFFTIAAAAGQDVHAGLPGVSTPRQGRQVEIPFPGGEGQSSQTLLSMLSSRRVFTITPTFETTWASRGWTLQEHALSRRIIIFGERQIFWECKKAYWNEETHLEDQQQLASDSWLSTTDTRTIRHWREDDKYDMWRTIVLLARDFQVRELSSDGDAYDAFSAILSYIEKTTGERFLWGLPTSRFGSSLAAWPADLNVPVRRTSLTTRKVTSLKRHVPFPSWTWLGWKDLHAQLVDSDNRWDTTVNEYYILRNKPLRLDRVQPTESTNSDDPFSPISLDDIVSRCVGLTLDILGDVPDDQYLCFRAQSLSFFPLETIRVDQVTKWNNRTGNNEILPGAIFFVSKSAQFLVSELVLFKDEGDEEGEQVHELFRPSSYRWYRMIVRKDDHRWIGRTAICNFRGGEHELVAPKFVHMLDQGDTTTVLEVEQVAGVSYRVGIAQLNKKAWDSSETTSEIAVLG